MVITSTSPRIAPQPTKLPAAKPGVATNAANSASLDSVKVSSYPVYPAPYSPVYPIPEPPGFFHGIGLMLRGAGEVLGALGRIALDVVGFTFSVLGVILTGVFQVACEIGGALARGFRAIFDPYYPVYPINPPVYPVPGPYGPYSKP